MRDKLRKWREDNFRNSEQIVDVGEELISEHSSKLGDDSKCIICIWITGNETSQSVEMPNYAVVIFFIYMIYILIL